MRVCVPVGLSRELTFPKKLDLGHRYRCIGGQVTLVPKERSGLTTIVCLHVPEAAGFLNVPTEGLRQLQSQEGGQLLDLVLGRLMEWTSKMTTTKTTRLRRRR